MKTAREIISDWVIENSGLQDNPLTRSASSRAADNLYSHLRESGHLCEWHKKSHRPPLSAELENTSVTVVTKKADGLLGLAYFDFELDEWSFVAGSWTDSDDEFEWAFLGNEQTKPPQ